MIHNVLHCCKPRLLLVALLALGFELASASNSPLVSGSYHILQNADLGSEVQVHILLHLVNHGPSVLSIERVTLWDFSHPDKGGSNACAITLRPRASADTTQEFTIKRMEYEQWKKGLRPRLVLQMTGPRNTKSTVTVRLDRLAGEEAK